jgi:hypothetical protein
MAIAVTMAVTIALMIVLAIRTKDRTLSIRSSSQMVAMACLLPRLAKWRNR